jgi:hypothetical protein
MDDKFKRIVSDGVEDGVRFLKDHMGGKTILLTFGAASDIGSFDPQEELTPDAVSYAIDGLADQFCDAVAARHRQAHSGASFITYHATKFASCGWSRGS